MHLALVVVQTGTVVMHGAPGMCHTVTGTTYTATEAMHAGPVVTPGGSV